MISKPIEFKYASFPQEHFIFPSSRAPFGIRIFEITFSMITLAILWPLILLQWIWIKTGTPGPGLFFQDRVGKYTHPFKFVKLRTMYVDARKRWPHLYTYSYSPQALDQLHFKVKGDPRVTPQGLRLRETSLDELPNFWNVIKGDMALVGPRPEIPEMLPYYNGDMLLKFAVRPGVTGLAQVSGRGRLSFYDTVKLDCQYVNTRSFKLDLWIIWRTIMMIVQRDGAF